MEIIRIKELTSSQETQLDNLWNDEYPVKLSGRFRILLDGLTNFYHYLIEDKNNDVLAWAVEFEKDNETRFSIIVRADQQNKGLGRRLIEKLKSDLPEFYGWVIDHDNDKKSNGENYRSPIPFYLKHGFTILHECRIDNEMLNAVKIKWSAEK
jgi:GNAT superfamily N-acetyltransferase